MSMFKKPEPKITVEEKPKKETTKKQTENPKPSADKKKEKELVQNPVEIPTQEKVVIVEDVKKTSPQMDPKVETYSEIKQSSSSKVESQPSKEPKTADPQPSENPKQVQEQKEKASTETHRQEEVLKPPLTESKVEVQTSAKEATVEPSPVVENKKPKPSQPNRKKVRREDDTPVQEFIEPTPTKESYQPQEEIKEEYEIKEARKETDHPRTVTGPELSSQQTNYKPPKENLKKTEAEDEKKVIQEGLQSGPVVLFFTILNYWQLIVGIIIGFLLARLLSL